MKRVLAIGFIALTVVLYQAGCSNTGENEDGSADNVSTEDVMAEAGDVIDTTQKLTEQQMQEFETQMQKNIEKIDARIQKLEKKGEELGDDAEKALNEQVKALKEKRDALSEELDRFGSESSEAWGEIVDGTRAAWKELAASVEKAEAEYGSTETESK